MLFNYDLVALLCRHSKKSEHLKLAKKVVLSSKKRYDQLKSLPVQDEPRMQSIHLMMFLMYIEYFECREEYEKSCYNGSLLLKYLIQYNRLTAVEWIGVALNIVNDCTMADNFIQSLHLLNVAKDIFVKLKTAESGKSAACDEELRFLEGQIELKFFCHIVSVLFIYVAKLVSEAKIGDPAALSEHLKKYGKFTDKTDYVIIIDGLPVDERFYRVPTTNDQAKLLLASAMEYFDRAASILTAEEKEEFKFDFMLTNAMYIKSAICQADIKIGMFQMKRMSFI